MTGATQRVTFPAVGGHPVLEGILHSPHGPGPFPAAVVCHPHPLMGGAMSNPVVVAACQALAARGWIALRFNFRGTGRSGGAFDNGRGELHDVAGAVDFVSARPQVQPTRLALVGYSFGAGVALHHAASDSRLRWLVGIALVQDQYDDRFLDDDPRPKLFVAGEHDAWAPMDALSAFVERLRPPKELCPIPGTDHFFSGCEAEAARVIVDWLDEISGQEIPLASAGTAR